MSWSERDRSYGFADEYRERVRKKTRKKKWDVETA